MRRSVFTHARWAVQSAVVLTFGSVFTYQGGSRLDRAAVGYSFSHNFLSDLGMTVTYNGRPNSLGALMWSIALSTVVFGLAGVLVGFARLYSETTRARFLSRAAVGAGLVVCTALLGVALTPENWQLDLHITFVEIAFRLFPTVPLLLGLASRYSDVLPRRVSIAWLILTGVLGAYVVLIGWGPTTATPTGLITQITAQKIATLSIVVIFFYSSVEAERAVALQFERSIRSHALATANSSGVRPRRPTS